jgi:hypothetical protein
MGKGGSSESSGGKGAAEGSNLNMWHKEPVYYL